VYVLWNVAGGGYDVVHYPAGMTLSAMGNESGARGDDKKASDPYESTKAALQ